MIGFNAEKGEHRLFSRRVYVVKSGIEKGEMVYYVVTILQTKTRRFKMAG